MRTILISLLLPLLFISCQSQKTDLKLYLEKGKTYIQTTSSTSTITQDYNGQKMKMEMTINGSMTFLVKLVNSNNYDMEVEFTQLSMAMEMPQGKIEFSSEKNDETDIMSTVLAAMKNKPFELSMSKTGKISDVKNIEELWGNLINQFGNLTDMEKEQVKEQIVKAYGPEAIKGSIEMATAIYPVHAVNKGDTWSINTKLESGMSANVKTQYKFKDINSEFAFIDGNSTIETEDKDAYVEANGMPVKYNLKGTMVSEIKVDKTSGWIVEAKINQNIEGNTFIKDNPQVPGGMKIPMSLKTNIVITNE